MEITNLQVHEAYSQGKRVYAGELSLSEAKNISLKKQA